VDSELERVNLKGKLTVWHAVKTQRGIELCFSSFLNLYARREWLVSATSCRTRYPLYKKLGRGPRPVWTGAENLAPSGFRTPDHPVRGESLYRLRYGKGIDGIGSVSVWRASPVLTWDQRGNPRKPQVRYKPGTTQIHVRKQFRFLPGCNWDLRSSGILHSVDWLLCTDVSGRPVHPIFQGQVVQTDGTYRSSQMSVTNYQPTLRNIPEEWSSRLYVRKLCSEIRRLWWRPRFFRKSLYF